jgi:colanic acid biosynthesis glycosyl transferase WcaI
MKILFINQCYWPDHVATAQILADLAEELAARGHEVRVLCSRNPYTGGSTVFPKQEHHNGVLLHRVATLGYGKKSGTGGRMLDYLSFHLMALLQCVRLPAPDAVITLTSPLLVGVVGWLMAALKRTKHVHWCMDLFPDTGVLFGMVKENGLAHRICVSLTRRYLRSACAVFALSSYMAGRIQRYGVRADRLHIVPVWADGTRLRPVSRPANEFIRSHQLEDKFVVMFSGNLELGGDIDTLVGALTELRDQRELMFVLISEGPRFEEFQARCMRASLRNVLFLPYQPRDLLAHSLGAGDVHVVTNKKGLSGLRVPCKTYGILAVGRPIVYIGEPHSEAADLIREHQLGFVLQEGDVRGVVAALRTLQGDPLRRQEISVRARTLFEADYDAAVVIDSFERIVNQVVTGDSRLGRPEPGTEERPRRIREALPAGRGAPVTDTAETNCPASVAAKNTF